MRKEEARPIRQDRAAQFLADLKGRPFDSSMTKRQAALLAAACAVFAAAVVVLEGVMRAWQ